MGFEHVAKYDVVLALLVVIRMQVSFISAGPESHALGRWTANIEHFPHALRLLD